MGVLTLLGVAGPVPLVLNAPALTDPAQQGCGVVRMLVRNRCIRTLRCPLRVSVSVVTSTIQALPGQLALIGSGASRARRSQTVSRPWRFL